MFFFCCMLDCGILSLSYSALIFKIISMAQASQNTPATVQPTSDQRIWAVVGYLWILSLVALALKKKDSYVRFHASQGVGLLALWVIGLIVFPLMFFINIIVLIFTVLGIIKAWTGEQWAMPIIHDIGTKVSNWLIKTLKI